MGQVAIFNNAAQHFNHSFYWSVMKPQANQEDIENGSADEIMSAITQTFGSLDKFKEIFSNKALNQFGSGWAWLILDGASLEIVTTRNADTPVADFKVPLLVCDVWEHAYYVDHFNKRNEYLEQFWNVVDWKAVN